MYLISNCAFYSLTDSLFLFLDFYCFHYVRPSRLVVSPVNSFAANFLNYSKLHYTTEYAPLTHTKTDIHTHTDALSHTHALAHTPAVCKANVKRQTSDQREHKYENSMGPLRMKTTNFSHVA